MKIYLKCRKAYEKVKGFIKLYISSKRLQVVVPSYMHINRYGKTLSSEELVSILCGGTDTIPSRNFIRDANKRLRKDVYTLLKEHASIQILNVDDSNSLGIINVDFDTEEVAMKVTALVKEWILYSGYYQTVAPNSPKTITNKGSDVPLVDTGMLVNSITAHIKV